MSQGKIIEYIDQGKIVCSLCLQDKVNKLQLLTCSNRQISLSPKRAILTSRTGIDLSRSREEFLEELKQTEAKRCALEADVNVPELWDLVESESESFDDKYLAELVFGEVITDDHRSALIRALFSDHLYFKLKDGRFIPNSRERIDQIKRQRREEALREERLVKGSAWLKETQKGRRPEAPSCSDYVIQLLTQLALYGNDAPDFKYGKELFEKAGIADTGKAKDVLIKLGVWDQDENLDLHRLGINTTFGEEELSESSRLQRKAVELDHREDLRHLPLVTIDGPSTRDFDDAVSLEVEGDLLHLGIHISDVSALILPDTILDTNAAERGTSIYLPRNHIPMIPPNLSQGTLCLEQDVDRPAISLIATFHKEGNLLDHRFVPSVVHVRKNLTYDTVNEELETDAVFQEMQRLSHILREKRIEKGALPLSLPELEIDFHDNGSFSYKLVPQETPSRSMVAEFMIFYNWAAARFCKDHLIPILFRSQAEPSERLPIDEMSYIYYVFQQRRKLSPLSIDTSPKPHSGLGLDMYTHFTSPIRRYLDLVMQRQLASFLRDRTVFYNEDELDRIRTLVVPVIREVEAMKRNRLRYWVLKHLRKRRGEAYRAIILDELRNKYRVLLTDFLQIGEIRREIHFSLSPSDEISVGIKKADPWSGILQLECVDRA
ncbi:MAG: RNB domain-containing ribonuclease [Desulfatiglans sp.]|jgi:exoribonuclease-2|nr:RNB domain-containing ribonuclease [Thermodesulfobacteriota bacterium]MEE4352229.1 RNB domain-containing ribonuclease [Desulfatiglans sp.]